MPARRLATPVLALALSAAASGCGGNANPNAPTTPHHRTAKSSSARPSQTAKPRRPAAPARDAQVIRRWSDTLRGGDEVGAARYFALPSIVQIEPGQAVFHITRRAEAVAFQAVLPCGARLLRAERDGRYVNALFRLTMRPGARCDAPGATARTDFVIRRGKITEWRRAPDEPGDGGGGGDGGSAPSQPSA